jgi:threonine/homoserine/homoserine lactone efflux protein
VAIELVRAVAIGLALGVLTGIPLGVVNVAVLELGARDRRAATWLGAGGALADGVHTVLAIIGYGAVITASPTATRVLAIGSAAIVVGYAVVVLARARRTPHARAAAPRPVPASRWRALALGLSLTLPNPGALIAWTAVAAAVFPGATPAVAAACAIAVVAGSAAWFAALAQLAARSRLAERAWPARVVGIVLLALAAIAVARAMTAAPA